MADADHLRRLWRYKSDLEEGPDEEKMIEILSKLKRVPVTFSSLKETGLGKLINRLCKEGGIVGDKAKTVVATWRATVEKEVNKASSTQQENPSHGKKNSDSDTNSWDSYQEEDAATLRSDSKVRKHDKDQRRRDRGNENQQSGTKHQSKPPKTEQDRDKSDRKESHRHSSPRKDRPNDHRSNSRGLEWRESSKGKPSPAFNTESPNKRLDVIDTVDGYAKYVPTKKPQKKISEEEELTDSDQEFGEEASDASNIEEYYKKKLGQNPVGDASHQEKEKNKKEGGKGVREGGKMNIPDKRSRDRSPSRHKDLQADGRHNSKRMEEGGRPGYTSHAVSDKGKDIQKESRSSHHKDISRVSRPSSADKHSSGTHSHRSGSQSSSQREKILTTNHSKNQASDKQRHKSISNSLSKEGKSSNSTSSFSGKGETSHKKVERKRKHHTLSDSEGEGEQMPEKQRRKNDHAKTKELTEKRLHSKARSQDRQESVHISNRVKVKKEKMDKDDEYGGRRTSGFSDKSRDYPRHPQCDMQVQNEHTSETEEDFYSPKHVAVKREKSWSPSPGKAYYSPSPVPSPNKKTREVSPADSDSAGSYSPSAVCAQASSAGSHSDSDLDGEESLHYSPQIPACLKQEELLPPTSSSKATPSYNPTPIKRERDSFPNPSSFTNTSGSAKCLHADQRKREPNSPNSEYSSDEQSPAHWPNSKTKSRNRNYDTSSSLSPEASPHGSPSPKSVKIKQESHSGSESSDSEVETVKDDFPSIRSSGEDGNCHSDSLDEGSRGYSPNQNALEMEQEQLTDSDTSDVLPTSVTTPNLKKIKHEQGSLGFSFQQEEEEREDSDRYSPMHLSTKIKQEEEEKEDSDRYSPMPLSTKIKQEPYSPTPKYHSSKRSSIDNKESKEGKYKSFGSKEPSHSLSNKSSRSLEKKSKTSSVNYPGSNADKNAFKDLHSKSSRPDSSSRKHKSSVSGTSQHKSSTDKYKSITGEEPKKRSPSEEGVKSGSIKKERHTSDSRSSAYEKGTFLSSSARNSPASRSDLSHVSSSSYPGQKRKSSSSSKQRYEKSHSSASSSRSHDLTPEEEVLKAKRASANEQFNSSDISRRKSKSSSSSFSNTEEKPVPYRRDSSSPYQSPSHSSSHRHTKTVPKSSSASDNAKTSTVSHSRQKTSSSKHRKLKPPKPMVEEPEADLFSEALDFTKALSSVPKVKSASALPSKSRKESITPSPTPSLSPPPAPQISLSSQHKRKGRPISDSASSDDDDMISTSPENNRVISGSEGEAIKTSHGKKTKMLDEQEEAAMSFEDFMNIDAEALRNRSKPSVKITSGKKAQSSSSAHSHKSHKSKSFRPKSPAPRSGAVQPSKETFHVPVPSKNVKVTPLDILGSLPETQAHYRPLPPRNHGLGGEDADIEGSSQANLEDIGVKKLQRTQVYSGRKQGVTEVKPLFELCMQVLIENIDAMDCVGGVPYSILRPVLERCTAQQLYHLEDYNPHFLEDTDELWERLCHRDFRGCQPDEMEPWREMYLRKHNEREMKYQKLKESMSTSISKGQTGRKAQLAYVDSVAKPPRDVLRKQMKFGTGCVKNFKGPGGTNIFKTSARVPVYNPMNEKRPPRPVPLMMAQVIRMRKNMRR